MALSLGSYGSGRLLLAESVEPGKSRTPSPAGPGELRLQGAAMPTLAGDGGSRGACWPHNTPRSSGR